MTKLNRVVQPVIVTVRRRAIANLRRAYFSQAGESATRYRITFDRMILHLWNVRRMNRRFTLRSVRCVDDLIHVVACIDNISLAWADLAERYERSLLRHCRDTHDEVNAIMLVRRMFVDLRRRDPLADSTSALETFTGVMSLRSWLDDRMNRARTREALARIQHRRTVGSEVHANRRRAGQTVLLQSGSAASVILPFNMAPALAAATEEAVPVRATADG